MPHSDILRYLLDPVRIMITINDHEVMLSKEFVDNFLVTGHMMAPELFDDLHAYTLDSYKDGLDPRNIFAILLSPETLEYDEDDMLTMQMVIEFYHVHMTNSSNMFSSVVNDYLSDIDILAPIHDSFEIFVLAGHRKKYDDIEGIEKKLVDALLAYYNNRWPALKFAVKPRKNDPERMFYFGKKVTNEVLYALTSGEPTNLFEAVEDTVVDILLETFDNMSVVQLICENYIAEYYNNVTY